MRVNDEIVPYLRKVKAEMEALNKLRIKVGIQGDADSELLMIANVHEYGATITAKNARNLCIPIHKDSYDKSPRDFQDLFFIRSKDGYLFGVTAKKGRKNTENANNLNFLFLLLPSVTIPERSFIRAGFDHNKGALARLVQEAVADIYQGKTTARQAAEWIGGQAVGDGHLNEDRQTQHRCDENGGLRLRISDQIVGVDPRVPAEGKECHPILDSPLNPERAPAKQPAEEQVNGCCHPQKEVHGKVDPIV